MESFAEGLAAVQVGERWGYINRRGKIVISPRFGEAGPFAEGRAKIYQNGKYGYIDRTGKIVIPPQFQLAEQFSEGLALVASGDYKYAFINRAGKTVIPPPDFKPVDFGPEEPGSSFSGGLAPVIIGEKCGFVDRERETGHPAPVLKRQKFLRRSGGDRGVFRVGLH